MAVSRSSPPSSGVGTITNQQASQTGTQVTTGTSTTNASTSSSGATKTSGSLVADYLDPKSRAALNALLKQLTNGTGQAANVDQKRADEVLTNQGIRSDYSKGNAFADAQSAMNSNLAKAIQQSMPTITAGIDAAGTSGSALSALLTQQAAEDAASSAAELGLQAAISYGQIQTGLSGVIESLLGQGSESTNALLNALGIAKGAYENKQTESQEFTSSQSKSSQTTNSSQITNSTSNMVDNTTADPVTAAKKKTSSGSGYGLLGSPTVTAMPGSAAMGGRSGQSYSQFG